MKLEEQVCTLEQAKRLQELGVKAESIFEWLDVSFDEKDEPEYEVHLTERRFSKPIIPAYTVAELGEMLPANHYNMKTSAGRVANFLFDAKQKEGEQDIYQEDLNRPTEAQARAAMLIHLLENAILSTPKTPEA